MANERTFLAWIRTSLALIAAGVALVALELPVGSAIARVAAALFGLAGFGAAMWSFVAWARNERALRLGRALPGIGGGPLITVLVGVAVLVLCVGITFR